MLIESLIKPRNSSARNVEVFGKVYAFKPVPGLQNRFVSEVADEAAVKALLATKAYTEFTDVVPNASLSGKPPAPVDPDPVTPPAGPVSSTDPSDTKPADPAVNPVGEVAHELPTGDLAAKAEVLLSGTPASIRKQVKDGPNDATPREVIEAALALEKAAKSPRLAVIESLKLVLEPKA